MAKTVGVSRHEYKHVRVYHDYSGAASSGLGKGPVLYVRLCGIQTDRFPHGIALNEKFSLNEMELADKFAGEVEQYIEALIQSKMKTKKRPNVG